MPNSDGTNNVWDALKAIGIAAIFAAAIVLAGTSIKHPWLIIPVTPLCTAVGAFLASRKSSNKVILSAILCWGGVGLVAGVLWYFCS